MWLVMVVGLSITDFKMGLDEIFNTEAAQQERLITGLKQEEQGRAEDAMSQREDKASKEIDSQRKDIDRADNEAIGVIDYLKGNEGFRKDIFLDTKDVRTIGFGFNIDDPVTAKFLPDDVLSGKRPLEKVEAREILNKRTDLAIADAQRFMGGQENFQNLSGSQKKAIIDMAYNLGLTSLNKFVELRKALFQGDKLRAKEEVLDSKYARTDVPSRALQNANLMMK